MLLSSFRERVRSFGSFSSFPSRVSRWVKVRDEERERNPWLILTIACSAMFLDLSNLSAITIALPTIAKEFNVDTGSLQWVISAYALTFGAFLLLGGRGGDIFGHRKVMIFGMSFFALFTMISGLSPTFIGLVIARAFQGIGAAFTIPSAQAFIALNFPDPKKKAVALGFWGASGSVGFVVGLILGGLLTDFLSWRWIFWVSLILSGILLPSAMFILPAARPRHSSQPSAPEPSNSDAPPPSNFRTTASSFLTRLTRFDILGITLGLPGILLLNYALSTANTTGWGASPIIGTLIASLILLAVFIFHETRAAVPLLPTHLFRSPKFDLTLLITALTMSIRQAVTYFLTLQLQSFGSTPVHTAVLFLPLGIAALLSLSQSGRVLHLLGPRNTLLLGHLIALPGLVLLSFVTRETSYWRFTFPGMILYITGIGFVFVTANFITISSARKSDQGACAAVFNTASQVGGSVVGLAVFTALAVGVTERYGGESEKGRGAVGEIGFRGVYWGCVGLGVVGLVLSLVDGAIGGEGEGDGGARSGGGGEDGRGSAEGEEIELMER